MTEFAPQEPMAEPFALMIDKEENVWIAEHIGPAVTKFNPVLDSFDKVSISNQNHYHLEWLLINMITCG